MPYRIGSAHMLHQEPEVAQWYRALLETTGIPAEEYLEGLHRFSRHTDTHPKELLQMAEEKRHALIERFRSEQEAVGHDARSNLAAVHSWIEHHKVQ